MTRNSTVSRKVESDNICAAWSASIWRRSRIAALLEGLALCLLLVGSAALPSRAQNVVATVGVGAQPGPVAVNFATNRIYVGNSSGSSVSVMDGATNNVLATVTTFGPPTHIAVNPATNKIYVANSGTCGCVTAIDGATNLASEINTGSGGAGIDVNPVTNLIYATNYAGGKLSVIDGTTNSVISTATVGPNASGVVVNPVANLVFVADGSGSGAVFIFNGTDNSLVGQVPIPSIADLAVNSITNKAFVIDAANGSLHVIDGSAGTEVTTVSLALDPSLQSSHVVVNPVTNLVYVSNATTNTVTVIDGSSYAVTATITVSGQPDSLAVDPTANKVYAANYGGNNVTVIDGATNTTVNLTAGAGPSAVAGNPVTDKIYVTNQNSGHPTGTVTVIDGSTYASSSVLTGEVGPGPVAANPVTNEVFVGNTTAGTVEVFNGASLSLLADINVGGNPVRFAVNPIANKAYAANSGSELLTVVDGSTNTATNILTGKGYGVDVNPVTNIVFATNYYAGTVTVIDGRSNGPVATVGIAAPTVVAANSATNQIYVASNPSPGGALYVLDGTNNYGVRRLASIPTIADVAVNSATNKVFAIDAANGFLYSVDVAHGNAVASVSVPPDPSSFSSHVIVNPITNLVYLGNATTNTVTVIDGTSLVVLRTIPVNGQPVNVAVNPGTNRVYVSGYNGIGPSYVTVIDGITNTIVDVRASDFPVGVAVNAVLDAAYVTDQGLNSLLSVIEQQVQTIPLTTWISPLPGNQATTFTPSFTFTASGAYSANFPLINAVYYQIDTIQNAWTMASASGPGTFTGAPATPLSQGIHILYALATDGEGPTSGGGTGNIAAYLFVVGAQQAPAITSANSATFSLGTNNSFTFTASGFPTPTFTTPSALDGLTFTDNLNGSATLSGSPSALGGYPLTIVATNGVNPDAIQSFTLTVNQAPVFNSPNSASFAVGTPGSFTVTATGTPNTVTLSLVSSVPPLPAGVTFSASTGVLNVAPGTGTGGAYTLTFGATNGVPPDAIQTFTLDINETPAITSTSIAPFVVGFPGTFQVMTTGFPAPIVSLVSSTPPLPSGVTFNPLNGVLSGVPAAGTIPGNYTLMFNATNGISPDATQTLTLNVDMTAQITSAQSASFTVGTPGTFQVTATGFPTPTLALAIASPSIPPGVTFNASTGVLSGTPTVNGVYVLTFVASNGVFHASTQTFTLRIYQAPVFTSANNTFFALNVYGTFAVAAIGFPQPTVSVSPPPPAGVTFNPSTQLLSGTPNSQGTYHLTFTATNSLGTATQNFTLSVGKEPTTTVIQTSGTPSQLGQPVTFTAIVNSNTGAPPNGETVTFYSAGALCKSPTTLGTGTLSGGTATLTTSSLSGGTLQICATYGGDTTFAQSTSATITQVVSKPATSTAVSSNLNPSTYGQDVTFTAAIIATGSHTPTGNVTFKSGSSTLATVSVSGTSATYTTSKLSAGNATITATYNGDAFNAASTSPGLRQTVNIASTALTLSSSPNPSTSGTSVKFTAVVISSSGAVPTGSVTFTFGRTTLGKTTLNASGTATLSTTILPIGGDAVKASYGGTSNFGPSSNSAVQTVH